MIKNLLDLWVNPMVRSIIGPRNRTMQTAEGIAWMNAKASPNRGAAGAHRRASFLCCGLVGFLGPTTPVRAVFSFAQVILQKNYSKWLHDSHLEIPSQSFRNRFAITVASLGVAFLCDTASLSADQINWSHVEATLIAEAGGEGYDGMLAVAEVMRARSWNLRPFCASRRKDLAAFVAKQPQYVKNNARRALQAAKTGSMTVHGATHYENVAAFGTPNWARGHAPIAKVGRHTFYRLAK